MMLKLISTRMTEEEAELVKRASELEGLNVASYIRRNALLDARSKLETTN